MSGRFSVKLKCQAHRVLQFPGPKLNCVSHLAQRKTCKLKLQNRISPNCHGSPPYLFFVRSAVTSTFSVDDTCFIFGSWGKVLARLKKRLCWNPNAGRFDRLQLFPSLFHRSNPIKPAITASAVQSPADRIPTHTERAPNFTSITDAPRAITDNQIILTSNFNVEKRSIKRTSDRWCRFDLG